MTADLDSKSLQNLDWKRLKTWTYKQLKNLDCWEM